MVKVPGGHHAAAGLSGSVRVLDPLAATATAKPVPVEQDPHLVRL
jgi:hypothetical protein